MEIVADTVSLYTVNNTVILATEILPKAHVIYSNLTLSPAGPASTSFCLFHQDIRKVLLQMFQKQKFLALRIDVCFWWVLLLPLYFSAEVSQEKMMQNQDSHTYLYGKQHIKTTL